MQNDTRGFWRSMLLTATVGGIVLALACMQPAPRDPRPRIIAVPPSRRTMRRRRLGVAVMLYDHRLVPEPGTAPPFVRVYRPRDATWLHPETLRWQSTVPVPGFAYHPVASSLDGGTGPVYPNLYELLVPTPAEAW